MAPFRDRAEEDARRNDVAVHLPDTSAHGQREAPVESSSGEDGFKDTPKGEGAEKRNYEEPDRPLPWLTQPIARYFQFARWGTGFKTEALAGATTFMAMAYILAVHPIILSDAIYQQEPGDLQQELVVATASSAVIGTLIMGVLANYPFALAPGMGINAFFTYSVVIGLGVDWRLALGCVFVEGVIFIVISATGLRKQIIKAIPSTIKLATGAGIGLFIAFIALQGDPATGGSGLIVNDDVTLTSFGSLRVKETLLAIGGFFFTAALVVRNIKGGLLWGIIFTAIIGWAADVSPWPKAFADVPPGIGDIFGVCFSGLKKLNSDTAVDFVSSLAVFLFVDLFDTLGTLTGVGEQAGYINEKGELPRANRALLSDSIATTVGAILGTSPVTTFVESTAGIAEGGRTGFSSVVTSLLFALSVFLVPVFIAIPGYATAPTLVIVGALMLRNVKSIDWTDITEAIPAFLVIFMIPLTYSIAEGLAIGFIVWPFLKVVMFRWKEVHIGTWVVALLFIGRFIFMAFQFDG